MAQKVAQMMKILTLHGIISKLVQKPTLGVLITNMDEDVENVVTKVLQMAQKVAQMTKYLACAQGYQILKLHGIISKLTVPVTRRESGL